MTGHFSALKRPCSGAFAVEAFALTRHARGENIRLPCYFTWSIKVHNDMNERCDHRSIILIIVLLFPFGTAESRNAGVDRPPCGLSRLETGAVSLRRDAIVVF